MPPYTRPRASRCWGGFVRKTASGRNEVAAAGWADGPDARPVSLSPLSRRDHQPRGLVVPHLRPELPRRRAALGRAGRHRLLRERPALVPEVRRRLRPRAAPTAAAAGRHLAPR